MRMAFVSAEKIFKSDVLLIVSCAISGSPCPHPLDLPLLSLNFTRTDAAVIHTTPLYAIDCT